MRLLEATPWAREVLLAHPEIRSAIEKTEPLDYFVRFGKGGMYGWTCRILDPDLRLMAEAFAQPSLTRAFAVAFARLPDTVEWRGTSVEVVD